MGPAHSTVVNRSDSHICVITFNKADLLFRFYNNLYVIAPGEAMNVESNPDPVGHYVAIVYKAEKGVFHYKRWLCNNECEMIVKSIKKYEIEVTGGKHLLHLPLFTFQKYSYFNNLFIYSQCGV